jgi:predicted site-specific integrase-resolvase
MTSKTTIPRPPHEWLTPAEASEELRVDPKTIARWRKNGIIPEAYSFATPGGHHRYARAWVLSLRGSAK